MQSAAAAAVLLFAAAAAAAKAMEDCFQSAAGDNHNNGALCSNQPFATNYTVTRSHYWTFSSESKPPSYFTSGGPFISLITFPPLRCAPRCSSSGSASTLERCPDLVRRSRLCVLRCSRDLIYRGNLKCCGALMCFVWQHLCPYTHMQTADSPSLLTHK